MPFRALVFDFDGLIMDTETPEVEAWETIFREHGFEFPEEWWVQAVGRGAEQMAETPIHVLERKVGRSLDHEALHAVYEERRMNVINALDALPGVRELIDEAKRSGIALAVASSSKHDWVDTHLTRIGLFDRFDAILCADDVQQAKPFPDLYLAACAALDAEPSRSLALEDSPNGIRAAKDAGLWCITIPNPQTAHLDLSQADIRLETLSGITIDRLDKLIGS